MAEIPNPVPPLCPCGARGCRFAVAHEAAFIAPAGRRKGGRLFSRTKRRHRT